MDRAAFLSELSKLLETNAPLKGPEELTSLGSWDSVTIISFMALVDDSFGVTVDPKAISECETVDDLVALVL